MCSPTTRNNASQTRPQQKHGQRPNHRHHHEYPQQQLHHAGRHYCRLRAALDAAIAPSSATNFNTHNDVDRWNVVNDLLQQLLQSISLDTDNNGQQLSCSCLDGAHIIDDDDNEVDGDDDDYDDDYDDPLGRHFLCRLLKWTPPVTIIQAALMVFPHSLHHNPAAFYTASRDYATQTQNQAAVVRLVVKCMMHRVVMERTTRTYQHEQNNDDCPYPWLLSPHISIDAARGIMEAYPQGVWEPLSSFSPTVDNEDDDDDEGMEDSSMDASASYCLMDYFLWSPKIVAQREWNKTLWDKFKLVLVAAEISQNSSSSGSSRRRCNRNGSNSNGYCNAASTSSSSFSPVRIILERILARPGFFDDLPRAQHVLWLLHQLRGSDEWVFGKASSTITSDGMLPLQFLISNKLVVEDSVHGQDNGHAVTTTTTPATGLVVARELCKILIAAFPEAVRQPMPLGGPVTGRSTPRAVLLPIHVAIANGWPCHDLLLSVFPQSLEMADPRTGLYPFQTAASCDMEQTTEDAPLESLETSLSSCYSLNVIFELLRANPISWISQQRSGAPSTVSDVTSMALA